MGVSRFTTTFAKGSPKGIIKANLTTVAVFIDMNQFIYSIFENMFSNGVREGVDTDGYAKVYYETREGALELTEMFCIDVINSIIKTLSAMTKLRELYITMDGMPCDAKIQNQFQRRKSLEQAYRLFSREDNKPIWSRSMTIDGTPLMDIFLSTVETKFKEFATEQKIALVMSLSNVAGEGEHKCLDYMRNCSFSSPFQNSDNTVLLWSNDSDMIISIIHQNYSNVLIMQGDDKCVSINDVRPLLGKDFRELQNAPLLLMLAGNDYLPEMLDSKNIEAFYTICREKCTWSLTKDASETDRTQIIDFDNLRFFFAAMSSIEIHSYSQKIPVVYQGQKEREAIFPLSNSMTPTEFKRQYYLHVHRQLFSIRNPSEPYQIPEDSVLFKLEIDMAVNYLKVFTWYYYYQSGYYLGDLLDNILYEYFYPPLYNSLFIVLHEKEAVNMAQFSFSFNNELKLKRREIDYFEKLPVFTRLHHFIVLSIEDYRSMYPNDTLSLETNEKEIVAMKRIAPKKDSTIPLRILGEEMMIYPIIPARKLFAKYRTGTMKESKKPISINTQLTAAVQENLTTVRYKVMGKAQFPS